MHIHLVGICGTGMGALAGLLREAGHRVAGSDTSFYPPMGDALAAWGVETMQGYDPAHIEGPPDLVVIGNVCRRENVEARAAIDAGLTYTSLPGVLETMILRQRRSLVVAGTHGKTTTTALLAWLLDATGHEPGFFVGGIPLDFPQSFRLGAPKGLFAIEGDEYDSAFFEKTPKFLRYSPSSAILTSIEHDHADIYPTLESYIAAFEKFVACIPEDGTLVAYAGDPLVRAVAAAARCSVRYYALDGDDTGGVFPHWRAIPGAVRRGLQEFDLFRDARALGRFASSLAGPHNIRNAMAAIALATDAATAHPAALGTSLMRFRGVRRRQELVGTPNDVHVYDDFAHHPTAVAETLRALRTRHPTGRIVGVFEPRSATASRQRHQREYPHALALADHAVLAPVGRPEVPEAEKLDVQAVAAEVRRMGGSAQALDSIDAIVEHVCDFAEPGDAIVVMSNGPFGGIHGRLLGALASVAPRRRAACAG